MNTRLGFLASALATATLMLTSACGGGGGDDVSQEAAGAPLRTGPDLSDATLWLSFDEHGFDYDGRKIYPDALDGHYDGRVASANEGKVATVPGREGAGDAVAFPARCEAETGCPRALVEVASDPGLDPGPSDFEYGASVLLEPDQTTRGSNLVQKGRFAASDSLWKLQVDSEEGEPSCVVRSGDDLVEVRSTVTIADGTWHHVLCRKDADGLSIDVDGVTDSVAATIGDVRSQWPVRIGAPGLGDGDDQFHGELDDVFLRVLAGE